MGQAGSQPKNKTGKNIVKLKTDTAFKTGVLSLRDHKLENIPEIVFELSNLRTLDLANNSLKRLPNKLGTLTKIKLLNCESNKLIKGSLIPLSKLEKLTTLSLSKNNLGKEYAGERRIVGPALPNLPGTLKVVKVDSNYLANIPKALTRPILSHLEKLDLSNNRICVIPEDLCNNLKSLTELNLDQNLIPSLPKQMGQLKMLKSLSLQRNKIYGQTTAYNKKNPQPIPAELFTETALIDLNLTGNMMTNTQLNEFEGFQTFLERRQKLKSKNIHGGALTDLGVCGLE